MEGNERPERAWLWEEVSRDLNFWLFLNDLTQSIAARDWPDDDDGDEVDDDDDDA